MENEEEAIVNSLACQPYCISWTDALLSYLLLLLFVYYSIVINQTKLNIRNRIYDLTIKICNFIFVAKQIFILNL